MYQVIMTQNIDGKSFQKEILCIVETEEEAEAFIASEYKNFKRPSSQIKAFYDMGINSPFRESARILIKKAV